MLTDLTHRLILKVKQLAASDYEVIAVMDGDSCPTEDFLQVGEATTRASREGLLVMIQSVAKMGLDEIPSAWFHEANKNEQVFEFIKGPLRLFFFKGVGRQIAVCVCGVRKKGQKADKASVAKTSQLRKLYFEAAAGNTLEVISDES